MQSLADTTEEAQQVEVWGWQAFFDELSAFLRQIERQESRCNQRFVEYALECFEVIIVNVTNIRSVFTSAVANCSDQQERDVLLY